MTDVKIQLKIGTLEFSGEGDKEWLAKQLDKMLEKAPALLMFTPPDAPAGNGQTDPNGHNPMKSDPQIAQKSLATFLNEKGAARNQTKKFLVTAAWLEAKGKTRVATSEVTKALKDNSQARLGNPSDCLKKNIAKGYCEKDGKNFFVTQEGKNSLS